jgi:chloramphenicol 3-O-phosphotransferase
MEATRRCIRQVAGAKLKFVTNNIICMKQLEDCIEKLTAVVVELNACKVAVGQGEVGRRVSVAATNAETSLLYAKHALDGKPVG